MTVEGHESCIPLAKFKQLQELHDNQKKIIAKQQQQIEELLQENRDLHLEIAEANDNADRST